MNTLGIASLTIQLTPPGTIMAGIIVFCFGDSRLNPLGFLRNSLNISQDSKEFYERSRFYSKPELKFSKINDEDKALVLSMDEGDTLQNKDFSEDMVKDKKLLNDVFQQISYVIFRHLLDIPEDEKIFNKYKENVQISSFSTSMNNGDKKLLVDEFDRIKHIINSHLFNGRKTLEVFEKYIEERELNFSNNMSEKDKKLLNDKFCEIRKTIDNFLLNEPRIQTKETFSEKMDSKDKELLMSYINNFDNKIHNIRNDIDNYILNKITLLHSYYLSHVYVPIPVNEIMISSFSVIGTMRPIR
uniref:Uncharacterized protein n=1 Tax=Rhizophagus irregularis (strain DAOM 181602 / DAOM 197198 / MUCL 43194) TaxID=747089 RepID=U9TTL3_RHIID